VNHGRWAHPTADQPINPIAGEAAATHEACVPTEGKAIAQQVPANCAPRPPHVHLGHTISCRHPGQRSYTAKVRRTKYAHGSTESPEDSGPSWTRDVHCGGGGRSNISMAPRLVACGTTKEQHALLPLRQTQWRRPRTLPWAPPAAPSWAVPGGAVRATQRRQRPPHRVRP
jgi:hypothetical protein